MASQWLVGDARDGIVSPDDSSFVYLYTAPLTEIFIEFDVYVCPAMLAELRSSGRRGAFQSFLFDYFEAWDLYGDGGLTPVVPPALFGDGDFEGIGVFGFTVSPTQPEWDTETWGSIGGGPIFAGIHNIKLHMNFPGDIYVYIIDGVTIDLSGRNAFNRWLSQIDAVSFGCHFSSETPSCLGNITNIVVSTSGFGGGEVISDDFSSGSISGAWTGTLDTVYVSPTPSCAPPPPPIGWVFEPYPGVRLS